jgi:putative addiction module component (TIGR02574 family)
MLTSISSESSSGPSAIDHSQRSRADNEPISATVSARGFPGSFRTFPTGSPRARLALYTFHRLSRRSLASYNNFGDTMQVQTLMAEMLRLSPEQRAMLAAELLSSLDTPDTGDIEAMWLQEAERRYEAYRSGQTRGIPAEEAFRQARQRIA